MRSFQLTVRFKTIVILEGVETSFDISAELTQQLIAERQRVDFMRHIDVVGLVFSRVR